jgi:hypothetical protein
MKNRAQFIDTFRDELAGLLISAFAADQEHRGDMAARGRWIQHQLGRVTPLLARMYEFIEDAPKPEPQKTIETPLKDLANVLLARCKRADETDLESIKSLFRAEWKTKTPPENGKVQP